MIQIAAQIRILVAVEAIDGRKGIDAIAQLCREKLNADPFSGYLFIFRTRRGTAIRVLFRLSYCSLPAIPKRKPRRRGGR
jgi:transposase